MRKIAKEFENPLDNLFIDGSEKLSPLFKKLKMTPNMITFISLIFGILAIYCLYKNHIIAFGIFYLISHFFDCFDGHFARKYKMVSRGGDLFDHIKDAIVFIGIVIIFIIKFKTCLNWYEWILIFIIIFMAALGMAKQLGCQERHYAKTANFKSSEKSHTLSLYSKLCKTDDTANEMRSRRWLGCGAFILITVIVVILTFYRCKNEDLNIKY